MSRLSHQSWLNYHKRSASNDEAFRVVKRMRRATVQLRAFLAETTITVNDLAALAPGDIITTERPANSEATLQVAGRSKFAARLGEHKGRKALKITRRLDPNQLV